MFSLILCIGTWPGPSIITWTSWRLRDLVQFAQRIQLGELRGVIGVGGRAGAQAVAQANDTSYCFSSSQMSSKCV